MMNGGQALHSTDQRSSSITRRVRPYALR